jgi:hypothetical protein
MPASSACRSPIIRLNRASPEWDDFGAFDGHPGPIAQFNFFQKLAAVVLEAQHLVTLARN